MKLKAINEKNQEQAIKALLYNRTDESLGTNYFQNLNLRWKRLYSYDTIHYKKGVSILLKHM